MKAFSNHQPREQDHVAYLLSVPILVSFLRMFAKDSLDASALLRVQYNWRRRKGSTRMAEVISKLFKYGFPKCCCGESFCNKCHVGSVSLSPYSHFPFDNIRGVLIWKYNPEIVSFHVDDYFSSFLKWFPMKEPNRGIYTYFPDFSRSVPFFFHNN